MPKHLLFRILNRLSIRNAMWNHVQRTRRLKLILLFLAFLAALGSASAQSVTLSLENASLQTVFKEINRQTNYNFFCKDEVLNSAGKIDIDVKNAHLEDVIKKCLNGKNLDYQIADKRIIIKPKQAPVQTGNVPGFVQQDLIIKG